MTDTGDGRRPGRWQTFRSWHSEPHLYREVYTRTVSALIAAFVIYLVAVVAGLVCRKRLVVILFAAACASLASVLWSVKLDAQRKAMRRNLEQFGYKSPDAERRHEEWLRYRADARRMRLA